MPSMNKVILLGNLTRDPEIRHTAGGTSVVNMRMAINRWFKDKEGEKKKDTCFINVVAWGRQADICGEYLHKGSPLLVEGRLISRSWEGTDGQKKHVTEVTAMHVQFIEPKGEAPANGHAYEEGLGNDAVSEEVASIAGNDKTKEEAVPF